MKNIKLIIVISILLVSAFMLFHIIMKIINNKEISHNLREIPEFRLQRVFKDGYFTNDSLFKNDNSVLIIYFNTECKYCNYQIRYINEQLVKFKDFQVLLVSIEEPDVLKQYFNKNDLLNRDFIYILYDKEMHFERVFGRCPFPTSFIYNSNKELVKIFKGEVKVGTLLKYLNE